MAGGEPKAGYVSSRSTKGSSVWKDPANLMEDPKNWPSMIQINVGMALIVALLLKFFAVSDERRLEYELGIRARRNREVSALIRRATCWPFQRHFAIALFAVCSATANANLLLSPLGGVTLFSSGDDDVAHVSLNSTYKFYGQSFSAIDVSTNGNMNFVGNAAFENVAFPDSNAGAMIAPLWDDFSLFGPSRIIEQQGDGYFAMTWKNLSTFNSTESFDTFQAIVFNKDENLNGFNFHSGDIAFSYGPLGDSLSFDDSATVGLNNADGSKGEGLPNSNQSMLNASELSLLDPLKDDFILFRFDGSNYASSYQHTGQQAVPEPASIVVVGAGLLALARKSRRKRNPYRNVP
jgi:hypothetical protein